MVTKLQHAEKVSKLERKLNVEDPVYALNFGPCRDYDPRWVPAIITRRKGTRTYNECVCPPGPFWRRHFEQLQARYVSEEDNEPGENPQCFLYSTLPDKDSTTQVDINTER